MMKRLIAALAVLLVVLCGCGGAAQGFPDTALNPNQSAQSGLEDSGYAQVIDSLPPFDGIISNETKQNIEYYPGLESRIIDIDENSGMNYMSIYKDMLTYCILIEGKTESENRVDIHQTNRTDGTDRILHTLKIGDEYDFISDTVSTDEDVVWLFTDEQERWKMIRYDKNAVQQVIKQASNLTNALTPRISNWNNKLVWVEGVFKDGVLDDPQHEIAYSDINFTIHTYDLDTGTERQIGKMNGVENSFSRFVMSGQYTVVTDTDEQNRYVLRTLNMENDEMQIYDICDGEVPDSVTFDGRYLAWTADYQEDTNCYLYDTVTKQKYRLNAQRACPSFLLVANEKLVYKWGDKLFLLDLKSRDIYLLYDGESQNMRLGLFTEVYVEGDRFTLATKIRDLGTYSEDILILNIA